MAAFCQHEFILSTVRSDHELFIQDEDETQHIIQDEETDNITSQCLHLSFNRLSLHQIQDLQPHYDDNCHCVAAVLRVAVKTQPIPQ